MSQPVVDELGSGVEGAFDEPAEVGGGGGAVETVVVIKDTYPHTVTKLENLTACLNMIEKAIAKIGAG